MNLFPQSPFKSERHVIDISGDGSNNSGRSVTRARDEAVAKDVTINGLPILAFEPYLDQYYHDFVIGGPGAFMDGREGFRIVRRRDPEEDDRRDRDAQPARGSSRAQESPLVDLGVQREVAGSDLATPHGAVRDGDKRFLIAWKSGRDPGRLGRA